MWSQSLPPVMAYVILSFGGSCTRNRQLCDRSVPAGSGKKYIEEAVRFLRAGGVVVFPTDTLYGLGADAFSVSAVERVCAIKGRPSGLALPLLVSCWEQVNLVAREVTEAGSRLANRFWPGPLTLVLPKLAHVPNLVTGDGDTVAVRMPAHEVTLALIQELSRPITGTSANRSGRPDLLTLEAVKAQLGDLVDYVISSGPTPNGMPSTVVDVTGNEPQLLRQGALPFHEVLAALG